MKTKLSEHGVYRCQYHLVWVTKYRRRILNPRVESHLRKLFPKIVRSMPEVEIEKVGFEDKDNVHLVIIIPPKYAVSKVVGRIKGSSGSKLRKKFPWLGKVYWQENVVWSPGYFVSTVGLDEKWVKRYVEWQGRKDSGQLQMKLI